MNMAVSNRRILFVTVIGCLIRLGDSAPLACDFASLPLSQATPTAAGAQVTAEPARALPESFMVVVGSQYALLGADGEEREHLHSFTGASGGAFSPDRRWAAFIQYAPSSPPGDRLGWLVMQSRIDPEQRRVVPLIFGTMGVEYSATLVVRQQASLVLRARKRPDPCPGVGVPAVRHGLEEPDGA